VNNPTGLANRLKVSTTDFQDVASCFQLILLFDREVRASHNQKQNTVTFQRSSGAELKLKTE
jgi:hypothetical protein